MIAITVNGEDRTTAAGRTLLDLLKELELDPERVAIEMDRRIVKQERWSETLLETGTKIEIVQFVGGG